MVKFLTFKTGDNRTTQIRVDAIQAVVWSKQQFRDWTWDLLVGGVWLTELIGADKVHPVDQICDLLQAPKSRPEHSPRLETVLDRRLCEYFWSLDIVTLRALCDLTVEDLRSIKGIGRVGVARIRLALAREELSLRDDVSPGQVFLERYRAARKK